METTDLIKIIYDHYPQNIGLDDIELYVNSPQYLNRVQKCAEARSNNTIWLIFKDELNQYATKQYNDTVYDYSVLGSVPCYSASMGSGEPGNKNSWMISILISVIAPLWVYRIIDFNQPGTVRYQAIYENEINTVKVLGSLINTHFPGYAFIDENQHSQVIPDIATAFKVSPTIFEAFFKEDFN